MNNLSARRFVITGANRGLGLEMVRQLLKNYNPEKIFASCRNPDGAINLNSIAKEDSRVQVIKIDLSDTSSFHSAVSEVERATDGKGIHVLVNNAGVFSSQNQSLEKLSMDLMMEFYQANTFGPIFLTQAFVELLKTANARSQRNGKGLVVNFTSKLGSISDNKSGGLYASRCSRAAMNAATKSMSVDLKDSNIIAIGMNPGWVSTDQGGKSAPLRPEESVSGILKALDNAKEEQSGAVLQYNGEILEW